MNTREVLNALLDKYEDDGIQTMERMDVLKVPPFDRFGSPVEIVKLFGGKDTRKTLQYHNDEEGSVTIQSDVTDRTELWIVRRDKDLIRDGMQTMSRHIMEQTGGATPKLVMQFECMGRGKVVFREQEKVELLQLLQKQVGSDLPWIGFYTYGEIGPISSFNCIHEELMRLLQTVDKVDGFETRMYRKDGSIIWVSIGLRTVRDCEGSRVCFEGRLEEITNRKLAEQALRESEQQYRQLSEALEQRVRETVNELRQKDRILIVQGRQAVMGEMISNIAHQWRQPLNMLGLLIQELLITKKRREMTDEMFQGNLEKTIEIIRGMSRTIDDFRYFFRPDEGKVDFRIVEPIEKSQSLLSGSLAGHGIRAGIEAVGDPVINGYLNEFVQVVLNILINARDVLIARNTGPWSASPTTAEGFPTPSWRRSLIRTSRPKGRSREPGLASS